ncbi:MAG: fibronectin type III domain-containing protein, partial [Betaproteobacteria bacterium]|nr:fibronectin type III domain-containing protein [Betaproteobacteria bacterium]
MALFSILAGIGVLHASTSLAANLQIAGGAFHTVALKPDGSLWTWGGHGNGQLGDPSKSPLLNFPNPAQIAIGTFYSSVAAGQQHTLALKSDGSLWAWGRNNYYQLGINSNLFDQQAPIQVPSSTPYAYNAVSAGYNHSIALQTDGTLWAWGDNTYGQVGNNSTATLQPSPIFIGFGYSAISAGFYHNVALKPDGSLWIWGFNGNGQLGDPTLTQQRTPKQIMVGTTFSAIAAGGNHTIALQADGSLWAWGDNTHGQVGNNTTINQATPVVIGTGYVAIAAAATHTLALKADGSLWAWGSNSYGQLGINDNTVVNKLTPTRVGLDIYSLIGAGHSSSYASYAAKADGSVYVWGWNGYGQLGLGDASNRSSPTILSGFTVVVPDIITPTPPAGLTTTVVGSTQVTLTWAAATDAVGVTTYKVYRDGILIATLGNVTSYTDTGLTAGTSYSYTISACDAAGNCSSAQSAAAAPVTTGPAPDTVAPTAPTALTATASGATAVNLTWTAATDNVGIATYKVYRNGDLVPINTTPGNVTSYSDTGLTASTTYSYTVSACDAAGLCTGSTAASATTTAATATLTSLAITCPTTITSGQTGTCTANASYSSGPSKAVTPIWSTVLGAAATIDATGTITASTVTVDTAVVINASYVEGGVTKTASATVTITAAAAPVPAPGATACTGTAKNTAAISIDGGIFKQVGESL